MPLRKAIVGTSRAEEEDDDMKRRESVRAVGFRTRTGARRKDVVRAKQSMNRVNVVETDKDKRRAGSAVSVVMVLDLALVVTTTPSTLDPKTQDDRKKISTPVGSSADACGIESVNAVLNMIRLSHVRDVIWRAPSRQIRFRHSPKSSFHMMGARKTSNRTCANS